MPVPGGELEAEMLRRYEMTEISADQADDQKRRADDHMRAVKAGRHEEGGAIDVAAVVKRRVTVLITLYAGERETEHNGQDQAPFEPFPVILQERVMSPGHGRARGEQNQRI